MSAMTVTDRPSVCVVNYNGMAYLADTLEALVALGERLGEIVLVDNGSTDGSVDFVRRTFREVQVRPLPVNRGAAAARNLGLEIARFDPVLFVDADIVVSAEALSSLLEVLAGHPDVVVAQAVFAYRDRPHIVQLDVAYAHYLGMMAFRHRDMPRARLGHEPVESGSLLTGCFLIDRRRLHCPLRFEETCFYLFEDHDYGLQLRMTGHRILAVPTAVVLHGEGTPGLSVRTEGHYRPVRVYHTIRNRWLVLLRLYQARTLVATTPALLLYEVLQLVLCASRGWLREWWHAVRWVVRHRHLLLAQRRRLAARRVLPDVRLLEAGPLPLRPEIRGQEGMKPVITLLDFIFDTYWRVVAAPLLRWLERLRSSGNRS
ncbi:Poly-beta-1,6-N-acetyl-D-glucosamine synthase [bacterium HR39]|nr:Poly-beta-1,6-N-acetyl-D-glucosamine synthase [bacterium HR39]